MRSLNDLENFNINDWSHLCTTIVSGLLPYYSYGECSSQVSQTNILFRRRHKSAAFICTAAR